MCFNYLHITFLVSALRWLTLSRPSTTLTEWTSSNSRCHLSAKSSLTQKKSGFSFHRRIINGPKWSLSFFSSQICEMLPMPLMQHKQKSRAGIFKLSLPHYALPFLDIQLPFFRMNPSRKKPMQLSVTVKKHYWPRLDIFYLNQKANWTKNKIK